MIASGTSSGILSAVCRSYPSSCSDLAVGGTARAPKMRRDMNSVGKGLDLEGLT